jgi:hypothetical protein
VLNIRCRVLSRIQEHRWSLQVLVDVGFGLGLAAGRQRGISDDRRRCVEGIHPDLVEESAGLSLESTIQGDVRGSELDRFCWLFERREWDLDSGLGLGDREGFRTAGGGIWKEYILTWWRSRLDTLESTIARGDLRGLGPDRFGPLFKQCIPRIPTYDIYALYLNR